MTHLACTNAGYGESERKMKHDEVCHKGAHEPVSIQRVSHRAQYITLDSAKARTASA